MNAMKTTALVVPLVLWTACTDGAKGPAEAAMTAAGAAMDSLKGDAAKYAPDDVRKLQSTYGVAKDAMANKDYAGALTFTKDIPAKAREVLAKADATRVDLEKAWKDASDGVTRAIDDAKRRLSASRKPPAGMDGPAFARARADLTALESGWAAATEQYRSGDWAGAIARARALDAKGQGLLATIGAR